MKELLTFGNVEKDFARLGIILRQTYASATYGVCEVTEDEFEIMCSEPDNINGAWEDCGWRYCEGSNQDKPIQKVIIMDKKVTAWQDDSMYFDNDEEKQEYINENGGVLPLQKFDNLLQYLSDEMQCSQPRNVCALAKDLAKYNNLKLSELFLRYQG